MNTAPLEELPANRLVLKRYRIVRPLAKGGMGIVYLGRLEGAAGFAKPVVIKQVLPEIADAESTAQFIREARILSNLQHPGIVGVLDFGHEARGYAMVLEYVHGYHAGHWLKYVKETRGLLPWETCILIVLHVLRALDYAHNYKKADGTPAGVIHRDISPSNILLDADGNVRLVDFGVARMAGEGTSEYETQAGIVKGKLPYLAPELFSAGDPSVQTDVYACGVVLYQLLTGTNPFSASNSGKIIRRVLSHNPAPINALRDDVPADIDRIVGKAIAKDVEERYLNAAAFAKDLARLFRRPESEVFVRMQKHIEADFAGPLPRRLDLESLESLDNAWRDMQDGTDRISLLSSSPPRPSQIPPSEVGTVRAPAPNNKPVVMAVLGGAVIISAVAAGALVFTREPPSRPQTYLVVESPDRAGKESSQAKANGTAGPATEATTAAPGTQPASAVSAPPPSPPAGSSPRAAPGHPASASSPGGKVASVSRRFAQRQGEIQACFQRHAKELEGQPKISVSFSVDVAGKVEAARLSPGALATTPLGTCVLDVARSTRFGPQDGPLKFSIPITARVSK